MGGPSGHRSRRLGAIALIIGVLLAGCAPAASTALVSPLAISLSAGPGTAHPAGAIADSVLLAPFAAGQTGKVIEGYNVPPTGRACEAGVPPDHCGNQRDGFDIQPSNESDMRVLAPVSGTVALITPPSTPAPGATPTFGGCVLITTPDNLNLNVCHFDESTLKVTLGETISRGCVLGMRDTTWIHLSLDDRYSTPATRTNPATAAAIPFSGGHSLEGKDYPEKAASITDQYGPTDPGLTGALTVVTSSNLPSDCGSTALASPTPEPQPTAAPSQTNAPRVYKGAFRLTGSMIEPRIAPAATRLADGRVLVVGGWDYPSNNAIASAEIYDPRTGKFSRTGSMSVARGSPSAILLADGRVLVVGGGDNASGSVVSSAEIYDPRTGKFSPTGSMSVDRVSATATLLANGKVLVAGGLGPGRTPLAEAEIFDPATGKFAPTGSLTTARDGASATLLADGRVLFAGGVMLLTYEVSAELYDPATGQFSATGSMSTARVSQTATLLSDGEVLIAGGLDQNSVPLASAELYSPESGTFSPTGSMATGRGSAAATLLADGRVLVAGGWNGSPTATADVFDPRTGRFRRTGSMLVARDSQAAVSLTDGRVLIVGGRGLSGENIHASAELFQ